MLSGSSPSYKYFGRTGLVLIIAIALAVSTNAAGLSFMDSVKEFFGFTASSTTVPVTQPLMPFVATTVFSDDFSTNQSATYTTSGAIGSSAWSVLTGGNAGQDFGARRNTSPAQLELSNDATAAANLSGYAFANTATSSFSSPYNTTLSLNPGVVTWTFNMRQPRADPSGFDVASNNYGVAYVLAGTSNTTNTVGTGYLVALGQSGSTDAVRLAKYTSGIAAQTNIITSNTSGLTDFGTEFLSVKVTYTPSTNTWELFLRNDGGAFLDPASGPLTSQGTLVDSTNTGSPLQLMGAFWVGATAANQTSFFDNITVTVDQPGVTATSTSTSTQTNTATPTPTVANVSCSTGGSVSIPDDTYNGTTGSMAFKDIVVPNDPGSISNVRVNSLGITHTWIGDLVIKLVHPDGTTVTLMSRPGVVETADDGTATGGDSSNLSGSFPIAFDQSFSVSAENMGNTIADTGVVCQNDLICSFLPNAGAALPGTLTAFNGKTKGGTWKLLVGDGGTGDNGTLDNVCVMIDTAATPTSTATNTDTPTSTNTATPTNTATNTATPTPVQTPVNGPSLVLSQVYGGGGGGSTYLFDYVEIKNVTQVPQTLNLLKLYYGAATGNFATSGSNSFDLPNVTLAPGQYFLVQLGSSGGTGTALPVTPDAVTTNLSMGGTAGKVALVNGLAVPNTCGATGNACAGTQLDGFIDWVAYGTGGNGAAGIGEGGNPSVNNGVNITSAQGGVRKDLGCQDTNNNNADFDVVTVPVPRNSASSFAACGVTLGNYASASLPLSTNGSILPDAAPSNVASMIVSSSTNFKGKLEGDPLTGRVRVTDAHPAGAHLVTVKAFGTSGSVTKTFTLTVTTPSTCVPVNFAAPVQQSVDNQPVSIAVGDLNGDGKQDVVTANDLNNDVSVLLGNGSGGLGAAVNYAAGSIPSAVAIADVDGDGKQDVIVSNGNGANVSVLRGTGSGTLLTATNFTTGSGPSAVAVGDVNVDGKPDLAVANYGSNDVSVLLGTGTGSFGSPTSFSVGTNPFSIAIGDFNGDGKQDIVTANYNSADVSAILGDGTGGFGSAVSFSVGSNPAAVTTGDFNDDGKQDIAVANRSSANVSILLGDGSGGFGTATNFGAGSQPYSVAVGDFNGDGEQDLVLGKQGSFANVSVLLGNGTGSFGAVAFYNSGNVPWAVAVGDLNGDGQQDILTANHDFGEVGVLIRSCVSTPTNTPTNTPVDSPTNTATSTPTNTATSTSTSTPTNTPTPGTLVINEVDYDQVGNDTAEFVELKNVSGGPLNLDNVTVELVNAAIPASPVIYNSIDLPNVTIPANGYYVICGDSGAVLNCDLLLPGTNVIQNGSPDAIGVRIGTDLVDALSYEGNTGAPYTEGVGTTAADDNATPFIGLSRFPDGLDTDLNNADFSIRCITPGAANSASTTGCSASSPTPTATFTPTPTATSTDTPTSTPTDTPTATSTATSTATATATGTFTPTATATETFTPTPTSTDTPTPTATETFTPTDTPTNTPTPSETPSISGTVFYGNVVAPSTPPRFVKNVTVASTAGSPAVTFLTGTNGQYTLTGFGSGSYTIRPTKPSGPNSAITSADAARTAQGVVGSPAFLNQNQRFSADVNSSGSVTSNDAANIARFAAGLSANPGTFVGNWKFFVTGAPSPLPTPPQTFNDSVTYANVPGSLTNQDYIGLLLGEVSGNYNTATNPRPVRSVNGTGAEGDFAGTEKALTIELPSMIAATDKEVVIPVNVTGVADKNVTSYQFDIRYDPSVIQPMIDAADVNGTVSRGLSVVVNPNEPGLLRVVVYGVYPIETDGLLLNLRFTTVGTLGSVTPISFEQIMFNEGEMRTLVTDGRIEVSSVVSN